MKAAILVKLNAPLVVVDDIELADKLGVGQVLVRVYCSTICGAQIGEITGARGKDKYLPHLLGHEGGGIVEEIGPGVTHVKCGDHVVMHWRKGVGIEAAPPKYRWKDRIVGGGWVTTFNEYAVVSENRLTPVDDDTPFEVASLMGCAITTALGLINNEAKLKIGQSIAVAGCGGVGLNVVQGAAMVSAHPIIAIDVHQKKLEMAGRLGATHFFHGGKTWDWSKVDVFVDCTGDTDIIAAGFESVAPGGRMVLVGQPHAGHCVNLMDARQHYCGKTLLDSQGGLANPTIDIPQYLKLYRENKLRIKGIITDRFPLDDINEAISLVRTGAAGRVALEMS